MRNFFALVFLVSMVLPSIGFAKPSENGSSDCSAYKDKTSIESFIKKNPTASKIGLATFCLGELSRKQYLKSHDSPSLKTALTSYEKVARKYASSGLAPDALLALGDLRRSALNDEIAARAAYFEVIDRYPTSAAQAKKRLNPDGDAPAKPTPKAQPTPAPTVLAETKPKDILVERPVAKPVATQSAVKESVNKPGTLPTAATPTPEVIDAPPPGTGKELVLDESVTRKRPLIVIDPGHGGDDQGAKGVNGILEKNVVLEVAKELELLLKERLRAKTFLTRTTDVFIPLADRTKLANDRNADLFVSVHANASEYKTAQGIETYYLDNTNEKSSLKLAERENASLNFGPKQTSDLGFIFSDLIQNVKLDDSISLAHHLQNSMTQTLSRYYQGVMDLGVKKAPFYVLVGAHMPCVLSEISFIDHPLEGQRLGEERYQKLIAQALYEGIRKFFIKREVK